MYLPEYFRVKDLPLIEKMVEKHSFAWLVSPWEEDVEITPLPVLVQRDGDCLIIRAHMARQNPHWTHLNGKTASIIVLGPHHYISPRWYVEEKSVPTWNYILIKITGRFEILAPDETRKVVIDLSEKFDPEWRMKKMEEQKYYQAMLKQIVGFRIRSERIEAKFKLTQNHPREDLIGVHTNLQNSDENGVEMAELMEQLGLV
ncbi:FMN-binding negative transcriptional regulator [Thermoplasmatales archaeon AK]|nr:FMN-binding negative transcriptional regulator [Thermoplasmatales archaeon AK]